MTAAKGKEVLYLNLGGKSRADIFAEAHELGRKWFQPKAFDVAIRNIGVAVEDTTGMRDDYPVYRFIRFEADVEVIER